MKRALGFAIVMIAFVAWVVVLGAAGDADAKGGGHGGGGHYISGGGHHGGGYYGGGYYGGGYYRGGYYDGGGTVVIDDDDPYVDNPCVWTGYEWRCYD